ncbi:MAG TPA: hydroxymethylglutaryl-CoA lyase [Stellaceae bacterium]|nr:hydroxymethylglutaryl-CoA lyase [Stellaceae bacterium]
MPLPAEVRMVEVGPRDGLQNEVKTVSTADKIALVDRLGAAGLTMIEAGAFVSPKWIPQMADSAQVLKGIKRRPGVRYPVLVPNMQGFEAAMSAGVKEIAIFAAASETFSRRNTNCSIEESFERFAPVMQAAKARRVSVRGYVSCVVDCPYEGPIAPAAVTDVAVRLIELGCFEVSLGETIGTATPNRVATMLDRVISAVPAGRLAVHFHDTYGQAIANLMPALERGVAVIDSSVAGLGGCPYAKGAAGNVASEDVLYFLNGLGIRTGVDLEALAAAGRFVSGLLGREPASKVARALAAKAAA